MKFSLDRDTIASMVDQAKFTISNLDVQPILKNFLIQAEGQSLVISGSDTEFSCVVSTKMVRVERPGKITIPAVKLAETVKFAHPGELQFDVDLENSECTINSCRAMWKLKGVSSAEFPTIPATQSDKACKVDREELLKGISTVQKSCAKDEAQAIYMSVAAMGDTILAADGHRISTYTIKGAKLDFTLPASIANSIVKILTGSQAAFIYISDEDEFYMFRIGDDYFIIRKLAESYPFDEAKRGLVDRKGFDGTVIFDREKLAHAIRRVSVVADDDESRIVTLSVSHKEIEVSAKVGDEVAKDSIECETSFKDKTWSGVLNKEYLVDAVSTLSNDTAHLLVSFKEHSPVQIEEGPATHILYQLRK